MLSGEMSGAPEGERRLVAIVALTGLALRLAFILTRAYEDPLIADDALYYFTIAGNILQGHGSTFDRLAPTNGYHPLWLGVLVGLFSLFGSGPVRPLIAASVTCAVLDVLSGLLLYRLLRRSGWPDAAPIAAAIWFLSPFTLLIGLRGMEASLSTLMVLRLAGAICGREIRFTPRHAIVTGSLLGLAGLARTDNLPVLGLAVAAVASFAASRMHADSRRAVLWLSEVALTAAIVMLPWLLWNQHTFGGFLQVSGEVKLLSRRIHGSLGGETRGVITGLAAAVKAAAAPPYITAKFLTGEEFKPPSFAPGVAAGLILLPAIAAWRGRRRILEVMRVETRARLPLFALSFMLLHTIETGFILRSYASWYALPYLAGLAILCGIAFAPDRSRSPGLRLFAGLCLGAYLLFLTRVAHQPRDGDGVLNRRVAAVAERTPGRVVVAGAWNAGGLAWAARAYANVRVTNLDGLVNNAAFAAVRRGTYRQYIEKNVDVLLEDPEGASMFLDPAEVDSLRAGYSKLDGVDVWYQVPYQGVISPAR